MGGLHIQGLKAALREAGVLRHMGQARLAREHSGLAGVRLLLGRRPLQVDTRTTSNSLGLTTLAWDPIPPAYQVLVALRPTGLVVQSCFCILPLVRVGCCMKGCKINGASSSSKHWETFSVSKC